MTVLTGYLGSGKTTLLQRLLQAEGGAGTAVLINEFGEIGLDHLLVRPMAGAAVLLQNGCICCSVRSDLRSGLRGLIDARDKGEVPAFERVLVETTGLADPVPIVQTLTMDPMLRHHTRLANLVATVDGRNGLDQLAHQPEAVRQAATADRLVITKTDLAPAEEIAALRQRLAQLNPLAPIIDPHACGDLWGALLGSDAFDPLSKTAEVRHWLAAADEHTHGHADGVHRHDAVHSFVFRTAHSVDWAAFAVWLSALVHRHGGKVLRIKGLLNVEGSPGPVVLNAVQHFVHQPYHLTEWPDADMSSRLVFIVQGLGAQRIRGSLLQFLGSPADAAAMAGSGER